jgi:hypothetical protein
VAGSSKGGSTGSNRAFQRFRWFKKGFHGFEKVKDRSKASQKRTSVAMFRSKAGSKIRLGPGAEFLREN